MSALRDDLCTLPQHTCTSAQVGAEKSLVGSGEDGVRRGVGEAGRVLATFSKCLILRLKFEDNFQSRLLAEPFWFTSIKSDPNSKDRRKKSVWTCRSATREKEVEKPDEGYDSTGEVGSLLIVVALLSNVVDCRPSQESGLLINHIKKRKVPIFIKWREAGVLQDSWSII